MNRKNVTNVKIAACAMAAAISFTGLGMDVHATGNIGSVLPSAGIDYSMQDAKKSTSLSALKEESDKADVKSEEIKNAEGATVGSVQVGGFSDLASTNGGISTASTSSTKKIEDTIVVSEGYTKDLKNAAGSGLTDEEESFKNLVIAKVNDYVNVRDCASEDGSIVGKLYNKSVGTYLEEENGWCFYVMCLDCGCHTAESAYKNNEERYVAATKAAQLWNRGKVLPSTPGD